MALKINEDTQRTAYHVNDGPCVMYAVDANSAVSRHPDEWSLKPWSPEDAATARKRLHERRAAAAQAIGEPEPQMPAEPEMSDADRAEFEEWKAARAKAQAILDAAKKEQAEKDAKAAQVAEAEAVMASSPPQPDPRRRPLMGAAKVAFERKAAKEAEAAKPEASAAGKPKATDES